MCLSFVPVISYAQYKVRIVVKGVPGKDSLFLAGSFNQWNPGNPDYLGHRTGNGDVEWMLPNLTAGTFEWKLTRGSWETGEVTETWADAPNRILVLQSDTLIEVRVPAWKDRADLSLMPQKVRLEYYLERAFKYLPVNLDSSVAYALKTFELPITRSRNVWRARALNIQGEIFNRLGSPYKALNILNEGVQIQQELGDSASVCLLMKQIGNVYWQMKDTVHALQAFYQVRILATDKIRKHPLHEILCEAFARVAYVHLARNQLDSANWYWQLCAEVDSSNSAETIRLRGAIAEYNNDTSLALQYYKKAMPLALSHHQSPELAANCYMAMARLLQKQQDLAPAIDAAREAFAISGTLQNTRLLSESGMLLSSLLDQNKDLGGAYLIQKDVLAALVVEEGVNKEKAALSQFFEAQMRQQELASVQRQSDLRTWLWLLAVLLVVVPGAVLLNRRRTQRLHRQRMQEVELRALRAQINPHFIFNCLASINRYIVKSDPKTASEYLTRFARLVRMILDNSANDYITLETEVETLTLYLQMEALRFDDAFQYSVCVHENLDASAIQIPSMLIQPYIENAIWHGLLHKDQPGNIWIRFEPHSNGQLKVEVEDNGVGRATAGTLKSKSQVKQKSYGMQISSDRLALINQLEKHRNALTITDLLDEKGNAAGTLITLIIPYRV